MAYERIKTEHAGAKNGGGAWMKRADAKQTTKRKRRQTDKHETEGNGKWGNLDEFSARGSEPMLRRLAKDEEAAGFS